MKKTEPNVTGWTNTS